MHNTDLHMGLQALLERVRETVASVLEPEPTPEEIEAYERREMAAAKKEYAQVKRDFREYLDGAGIDIVDYCHMTGTPLHEADSIAAKAGYHQSTWSDQKNITRRAKELERKASRRQAASRQNQLLQAQSVQAGAR